MVLTEKEKSVHIASKLLSVYRAEIARFIFYSALRQTHFHSKLFPTVYCRSYLDPCVDPFALVFEHQGPNEFRAIGLRRAYRRRRLLKLN